MHLLEIFVKIPKRSSKGDYSGVQFSCDLFSVVANAGNSFWQWFYQWTVFQIVQWSLNSLHYLKSLRIYVNASVSLRVFLFVLRVCMCIYVCASVKCKFLGFFSTFPSLWILIRYAYEMYYPACIYLFNISNRNTKIIWEISSKLSIKTRTMASI